MREATTKTNKTRTWEVTGWMNGKTTVTTVGGTRKEAKREATALAESELLPGRRLARLLTEA